MIKHQLISILFTSLISAYGLSADEFQLTKDTECTEKRLDKPPEVASQVPIQDQDGTRLCTAYASSQLIDCWRIVNDPPVKQLTSPLSLGLEYAAKTNKQQLAEFDPVDLLQKSKELNSCSYSIVRDHFNNKRSAEFIGELADYYDQLNTRSIDSDRAAKGVYECILKSGFSNRSSLNIQKIKEYMNENDRIKFVNKIVSSICAPNSVPLNKLPGVKHDYTYKYGNQTRGMGKLRDKINKRLDMKNPQPIGIGFCRDVLHDRTKLGITSQGLIDRFKCSEPHAAVIVGRRLLKFKNGDQEDTICQYLVRDSYGSSCNAYPDDPTATPSKVCENGQVWIDEDSLMNNTAEIFYLGDR